MKSNFKKFILSFLFFNFVIVLFTNSYVFAELPPNYKGTPFSDNVYKDGPQKIPGKIQCEYFDNGGPNVAYYDTDPQNNGSGSLNYQQNCPDNPGNRICHFRENEEVDISYTKSGIDNTEYNLVPQILGELYVGWTSPNEWINYTVHVDSAGEYGVNLMYTSHQGGKISLAVNNVVKADNINITTTYNNDPVDWRQWHHWNKLTNIATISLDTGIYLLTLKTLAEGNMNYDYLEFVKKSTSIIGNNKSNNLVGSNIKLSYNKSYLSLVALESGYTIISIYNSSGKYISTIASRFYNKGEYLFSLSHLNLKTGVYLIKASQNKNSNILKIYFSIN
jgi:hypothetical protein